MRFDADVRIHTRVEASVHQTFEAIVKTYRVSVLQILLVVNTAKVLIGIDCHLKDILYI